MTTASVEVLQEMACAAADLVGIDQDLFLRLVEQESTWNPNAGASTKDACLGLCQLNPYYGRWFIQTHGRPEIPEAIHAYDQKLWPVERIRATLLDPRWNLMIGSREMARLLRHWGNWHEALVAWNWGSGNLGVCQKDHPLTWMEHIPAESQYMLCKVLLHKALTKYLGVAT